MRILLAEDETELGTWLVKALGQNDFQVDWVNDGRLVRRSLKATKYDALILDLGLPGLGGHDVLSDLREADERLPVLVLTARDSLMERVTCLHGGADDFLAKPFREQDLLDALATALQKDQQRIAADSASDELRQCFSSLTNREQQVMRMAVSGLLNKQIADQLNLSLITVKIHRGNMMKKMLAKNFAELVQMAGQLGLNKS